MPAPNLVTVDFAGTTIPNGTPQSVTGQQPGTATAWVVYGVKNDGAGNDTAFNVWALVTGRLVSVGGDYLGTGVTYVDEAAVEVQLLDALVGGNATTGVQAVGFQAAVSMGDLEADETQAFRVRINGLTETTQVELLVKFQHDLRATPRGDHVGTGSGLYLGTGDNSTTDLFSRSASVTAAGTPDETVTLGDHDWTYRGRRYSLLASTLYTTNEDGSDVALSPADATRAYYLGLTLGDVVELSGTWSVTAATAALTGSGGDATNEVSVGQYLQLAGEVHEVLTVGGADSITLHTNHIAGATSRPAFLGWHVTKGDQANTPLTDADKPTLPSGELFSLATPAGQAWVIREGDASVEQGDVADTVTTGFAGYTASGLDVTISRIRAKVWGYETRTSTAVGTVTLPTNQTTLVGINGPDDASLETATGGAPLTEGAKQLWEFTTDGAGVTAAVDLRNFQDHLAVPVSFHFSTPSNGSTRTWRNASTSPLRLRPNSLKMLVDVAPMGGTSGSVVFELQKKAVDGTATSLFRSQGTDDRRPTLAQAAVTEEDVGLPEALLVEAGSVLVGSLVMTGDVAPEWVNVALLADTER